jgi:hypothetical protein
LRYYWRSFVKGFGAIPKMGFGVISRSDWELHHEAPGAVVMVAAALARSWEPEKVREALEGISKTGDGWPQRLAYELAHNGDLLKEVIDELKQGLRVSPQLIDEVSKRIGLQVNLRPPS